MKDFGRGHCKATRADITRQVLFHRDCGGCLGWDGWYLFYKCRGCSCWWKIARILAYTDEEIADRFYVPVRTEGAAERLEWTTNSEGKQHMRLVPV